MNVHKEQDCARSWCALSMDVLVSVLDVQCYASGEKCGVASSSPSSLASVSLSFRSTCTILLFHIVVLILLVVILYQFIPLFARSHFSHMFSLCSHGILGVVFTHSVGYSRPPSAVNDLTVTKQVNSRKSCLEELFHSLV